MQTLTAWAQDLARTLLADAWLHDIGYLPDLVQTGLHGLDGACYLRDAQHADPLLPLLVAHHSCAVTEAAEIHDRYGPSHLVSRSIRRTAP